MPSIFRAIPTVPTTIPQLPPGLVDSWTSETHELDLDLTEHPIERGTTLTDHAIFGPRRLFLEGVISDSGGRVSTAGTALRSGIAGALTGGLQQAVGTAAAGAVGSAVPGARITVVSTLLEQYMKNKVLLDIITPIRLYRNMAVVKVGEPQNAQTGRSLILRVELREVLFTESAITRIARAFASGIGLDRTSIVNGGTRIVRAIRRFVPRFP